MHTVLLSFVCVGVLVIGVILAIHTFGSNGLVLTIGTKAEDTAGKVVTPARKGVLKLADPQEVKEFIREAREKGWDDGLKKAGLEIMTREELSQYVREAREAMWKK